MFENGTSNQNETDYPKTDYPRQLLIHERTQPKDQVFDDIIAPTLYSIIGFVPLLYPYIYRNGPESRSSNLIDMISRSPK